MGSDVWEMQEEASAPKLVGNVNLHIPMSQTILAVGVQEQWDTQGEQFIQTVPFVTMKVSLPGNKISISLFQENCCHIYL